MLRGFYDLARARGLALIVDETYRDFDLRDTAPHGLFSDPDWGEVLIQLYSFSKAYRLTGHRVGALVASGARQVQVEKLLDTLSICTAQLGQIGALWGCRTCRAGWRGTAGNPAPPRRHGTGGGGAGRLAAEGLRGVFRLGRASLRPGSATLAQRLVHEAGVLLLPGTMFMPEGDPDGARHLRIAFANVDETGIAALADRLRALAGRAIP